MTIETVGLAMETLKTTNGVVSGCGTIYSTDRPKQNNDYCDDFNFSYDITDGVVITDIDETIFGGYLEVIDVMLIENLQTNYLQK